MMVEHDRAEHVRQHLRRHAGRSPRYVVTAAAIVSIGLVATGLWATCLANAVVSPARTATQAQLPSISLPLPPLLPLPTNSAPRTTSSTGSVTVPPVLLTPPTSAIARTPPANQFPGDGLPTSSRPEDMRPGPGRLFTITASSLTVADTQYRGVEAQDVAGRPIRTIHLTVKGLTIADLVERADLANGRILTITAGGMSSITSGPIEMYVEKLTGTLNVVGLPTASVTLSAQSVLTPNVDLGFLSLPTLTLNNVTARIVFIRGGDVHVPNAHQTIG